MVHERVPAVRIHICCLLHCEVVGWKAANLWAWEERQRKWTCWDISDSSFTWCCLSEETGWHVCNNARSFPGIQMVKPPRRPGNTLLWRAAWARGCDPAAERRPSPTLYRPLKHLCHTPKPTDSLQFTDWTQHAPTHDYFG